MKEGFVLIRYVASDGSEGEVLIESDKPEELFHRLRRESLKDGKICNRNQLTLCLDPVAVEQQRAHTFV